VAILSEHRDVLDELVAELVANETVDGSDVYRMAGRTEPSDGPAVTVAPGRTLPPPDEQSTPAGAAREGGSPDPT